MWKQEGIYGGQIGRGDNQDIWKTHGTDRSRAHGHIRAIIREARELLLDGLTQLRPFNYTVLRLLTREHLIEVAHIDRARDLRLEGWLNLLCAEKLEVNVEPEEGVSFDFFCATDTESFCGVAAEKTSEDGTCV